MFFPVNFTGIHKIFHKSVWHKYLLTCLLIFLHTAHSANWTSASFCWVDLLFHIPAGQCCRTPHTRNYGFALSWETLDFIPQQLWPPCSPHVNLIHHHADWVLSHWGKFIVHRFICVYRQVLSSVCVFVSYCICVVLLWFVSTVVRTWWDWSLILRTYLPSVLWHYWLGHLACKRPSLIWPVMCLLGR